MATLADWVNAVNNQKAAAAGLDPVTAKILQNYGYMAGYLDHPEIGPLLKQAAANGWSKEILQGKLYATAWWKNTSSARRELEMLQKTDPAEYNARVQSKAMEIQLMAQQGGAWFSNWADVVKLAVNVLGDPSISPEIQKYMVFSHAEYKQGIGGTLGSGMAGIKGRAADFMVPLSDKEAFRLSKRIAMGADTAEGVDVFLRNMAKSRFSHLADDLDRGATTKELFDPYIQQTAQLLEVAPETIDLMDRRWSPMTSTKDQETGKVRTMTLSEAGEYVRRSTEYDGTQTAVNESAKFAENLINTLGKVAS